MVAIALCAPGTAPAPPAERLALVVGISRYAHAEPLRPAAGDARLFAGALRDSLGFGEQDIVLLEDSKAAGPAVTAARFEAALAGALARVTRRTTFVFYFSGHGVRARGQDWLVPADGVESRVSTTCVSVPGLLARLAERGPERALVFLDTCRDPVPPTLEDLDPLGDPKQELPVPKGAAVFFSCAPGELSRESHARAPLKGSVFTHYLVEALSAADSGRTLASVAAHVGARVSAYVKRHYLTPQTPVLCSSVGDLVLRRGSRVSPRDRE